VLYLKKDLYKVAMTTCIQQNISIYQLAVRAIIQYLGYKCDHDWRSTDIPHYYKYRPAAAVCVRCGLTKERP
jgi:hypothetical protein